MIPQFLNAIEELNTRNEKQQMEIDELRIELKKLKEEKRH
jgi:hypothetical protein